MNERPQVPPIATPKNQETPPASYGEQGVSAVLMAHQPTAIGAFKLNYFSEPDYLAETAKEAL